MDTWRAMEKLVEKGLTKTLAVCNFTTAQLRRLMKEATIKPSLLQVESNPRIHNEIIRYIINILLFVTVERELDRDETLAFSLNLSDKHPNSSLISSQFSTFCLFQRLS